MAAGTPRTTVAAGALGITVCVASGDHGTADQDASRWDGKIHVDHPACDDLVLGCGGTQIEAGHDVDKILLLQNGTIRMFGSRREVLDKLAPPAAVASISPVSREAAGRS